MKIDTKKRRCSICKQFKDLINFPRKDAYGRRYNCRSCYNEKAKVRSRAHYAAHKPYYKKRNQLRTVQIVALVLSFKLSNPVCTDCALPHPPHRLDFDHLPGQPKFEGVSQLRTRRWSDARVLQEIAKCELVCANCHRDRTFLRNRDG